jgi:CRISPR-associated protein Csm2
MAYNNYGNTGYQGNRGNNGFGNNTQPKKFEPLNKLTYVDNAEKIMSETDRKGAIPTNQIRIILDLINEVYIPVKASAETKLSEDILSKLKYIKMKIAYQAGRDEKVKNFVINTNIMNYIDNVKTKDDVILLAHYMEALVAYHKYYKLG